MSFECPPLPYDYDALEPHIDERTMRIHHDKHHAGYVAKLNAALEGYPELQKKSVNELLKDLSALPDAIRTAVQNNGGGHSNHTLFWTVMGPESGGKPDGNLAAAIDKSFGSFESFKEQFTNAAATRFGSGWGWLCVDAGGDLVVTSTANQDTPLSDGKKPILGVDVWEHAYYLKYQNRRPDYLAEWWNVVNWKQVAANYEAARK